MWAAPNLPSAETFVDSPGNFRLLPTLMRSGETLPATLAQ